MHSKSLLIQCPACARCGSRPTSEALDRALHGMWQAQGISKEEHFEKRGHYRQ